MKYLILVISFFLIIGCDHGNINSSIGAINKTNTNIIDNYIYIGFNLNFEEIKLQHIKSEKLNSGILKQIYFIIRSEHSYLPIRFFVISGQDTLYNSNYINPNNKGQGEINLNKKFYSPIEIITNIFNSPHSPPDYNFDIVIITIEKEFF